MKIRDDIRHRFKEAVEIDTDDEEFPGNDAHEAAVRGQSRDVKPDGKTTNRNTDPANVLEAQTTRNNPDGCTNIFEFPAEFRLRAGPRKARSIRPWQPRRQMQRRESSPHWRYWRQETRFSKIVSSAAAGDASYTVPGGVPSPADSLDTDAMHTSAANDTPLADTPDCSTALARRMAKTSTRSPSAGTAAGHEAQHAQRGLDQTPRPTQTEESPRETLLLSQDQPRDEGINFCPRRFLRSLTIRRGELHSTVQFKLHPKPTPTPLSSSDLLKHFHSRFQPRSHWTTSPRSSGNIPRRS